MSTTRLRLRGLGTYARMITILLIVLLVVILAGGFGGGRYYRGRTRRL